MLIELQAHRDAFIQNKNMHPFKQPQITRRTSSLQTPPPPPKKKKRLTYLILHVGPLLDRSLSSYVNLFYCGDGMRCVFVCKRTDGGLGVTTERPSWNMFQSGVPPPGLYLLSMTICMILGQKLLNSIMKDI